MKDEEKVVNEPVLQKRLDGPKEKDFTYPDDYKEKNVANKDLPANLLKFQ